MNEVWPKSAGLCCLQCSNIVVKEVLKLLGEQLFSQTAVTVIGGTDTYTYDATGQKLRKVNVNGSNTVITDYISGIQYKNNSTAIDFIQTEEGKAVP